MTDYIRRYPIHPVQSCKSQRQYRLLEARYAIAGQTAIVHQVWRPPRTRLALSKN
jgi:hypothetical protein